MVHIISYGSSHINHIIRLNRCLRRMLETKYVGDNLEMPPISKFCHQHPKIVTNIKSPASTCHEHLCSHIIWTISYLTISYGLSNYIICILKYYWMEFKNEKDDAFDILVWLDTVWKSSHLIFMVKMISPPTI